MIQWHLLTGPGLSGRMSPAAATLLCFVTDPFRFDGVINFLDSAVFTDERSEEDVVEDESSVEAEKLLFAGDFATCGFFFFAAISGFEGLTLFPVEQRIARGSTTIGLTGERSLVSADIFEEM